MSIVTLLDWCSVNGIRIHPNLRIVHDDQKEGICVRAANDPILPEQSRKQVLLSFHTRPTPSYIRARYSLPRLLTKRSLCICPSSVGVSCRNPEIRRAVHPFVCIGRPYPSRAVRPRCHSYPILGPVFRTVRFFFRNKIDRALTRRRPTYPHALPPIKLSLSCFATGYWTRVLDGPGTSSPSRTSEIGRGLPFSGVPPLAPPPPPCVILRRSTTLVMMMGAEPSPVSV
jgi:hypothetical protein